MDANVIIQAIGSFGFPVVFCLLMGWYIKYTTDINREDIKDLQKIVTETINNNTIALNTLCNKIDFLSGKGESK